MIVDIILIVIAVICFFISYKQSLQKGFVFNNRYIFASEKERKEKNWTDYYVQSKNIFALIGLGFIICTSYVIDKYFFLFIIWVVITILYALISSYRIVKKHGL